MIAKKIGILIMIPLCLSMTAACFGRDVLFRKAARNYGIQGEVGAVYRREFESRMFTHSTWEQRLYYSPFDPDINETLEVYSRPDGSRWLSYRRASPSLGRIISARIRWGEKLDLKKELDAVHITGQEVALPTEVANEIKLLWQKMLPGMTREPTSEVHAYYVHAPNFVAFGRDNSSINTGEIATAAYGTEAYREFAGIVDDLTKLCDGTASTPGLLARLPDKMRKLRARL